MTIKTRIFTLLFLCSFTLVCKAQIEVEHISMKEFKSTGFGGFLNFSMPVSDANYATIEAGLQYFNDKYDEEVALIPVLLGYRYTLNQSGTGFYVEPNAGYCFGSTTVQEYDANGGILSDGNGNWLYEKVNGPVAGVGVGYLFEPGKIQFNLALRYQHTFGSTPTNLFAFRISHAFTFGRRDDY